MSQTAYNNAPAEGKLGLLADNGPHRITSRLANEDIVHGRFVSDDHIGGMDLPSDEATDDILGVLLASQAIESTVADGSDPSVKEGRDGNVVQQGVIWVWCETAFDPATASVFIRKTANGAGKNPGQVRNDADSGKAVISSSWKGLSSSYIRVLNTLTGAGLLKIQINLP